VDNANKRPFYWQIHESRQRYIYSLYTRQLISLFGSYNPAGKVADWQKRTSVICRRECEKVSKKLNNVSGTGITGSSVVRANLSVINNGM
jgi:hypothetical protein